MNPENFYEQYQTQQPEQQGVQLDELCWNVFNTDAGKELMKIIKERFLVMPAPGPVGKDYPQMCVFYEGFREAFRQIVASVDGYQQKKDFEAKQAGV